MDAAKSWGEYEAALLDTYRDNSLPPQDVAAQYYRVTEFASRNPNKGSSAIANALDVTRSRIRPWVDGDSVPDCVRGLETARANGWLPWDPTDASRDATSRGLARLLAWTMAGGSLRSDTFQPRFVADRDERPLLEEAVEQVSLHLVNARDDQRAGADEWRVRPDACILGRTLAGLGATPGEKAETAVAVPEAIADAPLVLRSEFARVYAMLRGTERPDRSGIGLQIKERRNDSYLASLANLLDDVTRGGVTRSGEHIYLSTDAVAELSLA